MTARDVRRRDPLHQPASGLPPNVVDRGNVSRQRQGSGTYTGPAWWCIGRALRWSCCRCGHDVSSRKSLTRMMRCALLDTWFARSHLGEKRSHITTVEAQQVARAAACFVFRTPFRRGVPGCTACSLRFCRLAQPRNSNMAAPKSNSRTGTERTYPLMTRYIPSGTRPKVCIARRFDHDVERRSTARRHCLWSCVARRPPGRWTMWPNPAPVNGQPFGSAGVAASTSSKFPRLVRDSSLSLLNSIPLRHQHE
jgi:hypothetical protein